eukprot:m.478794 g.478794  ORF g.478794 m.478794 type:complete len:271 (-) comp21695_c1_seq8:254-1066(-)
MAVSTPISLTLCAVLLACILSTHVSDCHVLRRGMSAKMGKKSQSGKRAKMGMGAKSTGEERSNMGGKSSSDEVYTTSSPQPTTSSPSMPPTTAAPTVPACNVAPAIFTSATSGTINVGAFIHTVEIISTGGTAPAPSGISDKYQSVDQTSDYTIVVTPAPFLDPNVILVMGSWQSGTTYTIDKSTTIHSLFSTNSQYTIDSSSGATTVSVSGSTTVLGGGLAMTGFSGSPNATFSVTTTTPTDNQECFVGVAFCDSSSTNSLVQLYNVLP